MPHSAAQQIIEYTALAIGMLIKGTLLTGQAMTWFNFSGHKTLAKIER